VTEDRVNADFSRRAVVATDALPWLPSPQAGVQRRLLDRIGGEVARATSLVRYAPGRSFTPHVHGLGEEFLVLDGVFSDEHGDYPAGSYVRNPPGSRHAPRTEVGCTIFVKLRQMQLAEQKRIVLDIAQKPWQQGETDGHTRMSLYADSGETVTVERLEACIALLGAIQESGEEILVLSGELGDETGTYGPRTWIRNPAGHRRSLWSSAGATYWVKRGHLGGTAWQE
jgi:anti-sigma factor ChrR (cupin superfamily)